MNIFDVSAISVLAFTAPINSMELVSQKHEYHASVRSGQFNQYSVFDDLTVYSKPVSISAENQKIAKYLSRLKVIQNLKYNWDGHRASNISYIAINNTINFLKKIPDYLLADISADDIFPSPYGTVFIELEKGKNEISIEVGENEISFFAEINSKASECENIHVDEDENQMYINEIVKNLQEFFG